MFRKEASKNAENMLKNVNKKTFFKKSKKKVDKAILNLVYY